MKCNKTNVNGSCFVVDECGWWGPVSPQNDIVTTGIFAGRVGGMAHVAWR